MVVAANVAVFAVAAFLAALAVVLLLDAVERTCD